VGRHWAGHSSAARSVLDNELLAKPLREPAHLNVTPGRTPSKIVPNSNTGSKNQLQ